LRRGRGGTSKEGGRGGEGGQRESGVGRTREGEWMVSLAISDS